MKKIIEQYNNQLAKVYDQATLGEFKWLAPEAVSKTLLPYLVKKTKILDLGTGTGQSSEEFYSRGHDIFAIDISNEMLFFLRKKFPKIRIVKFDIEAGIEKLKFKPKTFGVIISVGLFEFIKDLRKLFIEVSRIIKTDGLFCFTFEKYISGHCFQGVRSGPLGLGLVEEIPKLLSFKVYRRTESEVIELLEGLGFKILRFKKFIGYLKSEKKFLCITDLF